MTKFERHLAVCGLGDFPEREALRDYTWASGLYKSRQDGESVPQMSFVYAKRDTCIFLDDLCAIKGGLVVGEEITALSWDKRDATLVVATSKPRIIVYSSQQTEKGITWTQLRQTLVKRLITSLVTFQCNRNRYFFSTDEFLQLWDLESLSKIVSNCPLPLKGQPRQLKVSSDGTLVALLLQGCDSILVWRIETTSFGHEHPLELSSVTEITDFNWHISENLLQVHSIDGNVSFWKEATKKVLDESPNLFCSFKMNYRSIEGVSRSRRGSIRIAEGGSIERSLAAAESTRFLFSVFLHDAMEVLYPKGKEAIDASTMIDDVQHPLRRFVNEKSSFLLAERKTWLLLGDDRGALYIVVLENLLNPLPSVVKVTEMIMFYDFPIESVPNAVIASTLFGSNFDWGSSTSECPKQIRISVLTKMSIGTWIMRVNERKLRLANQFYFYQRDDRLSGHPKLPFVALQSEHGGLRVFSCGMEGNIGLALSAPSVSLEFAFESDFRDAAWLVDEVDPTIFCLVADRAEIMTKRNDSWVTVVKFPMDMYKAREIRATKNGSDYIIAAASDIQLYIFNLDLSTLTFSLLCQYQLDCQSSFDVLAPPAQTDAHSFLIRIDRSSVCMEELSDNLICLNRIGSSPVKYVKALSFNLIVAQTTESTLFFKIDPSSCSGYEKALQIHQTDGFASFSLGNGYFAVLTYKRGKHFVNLHLPFRGSLMLDCMHQKPWNTVQIDLRHPFQDFTVENVSIFGLSHLMITGKDSICTLSIRQLLFESKKTCIFPSPSCHPMILNEGLCLGKQQFLQKVLRSLEYGGSLILNLDAEMDAILDDSRTSFPLITMPDFKEKLKETVFPFLSSRDNLHLLSIVESIEQISQKSLDLDFFALRYTIALKRFEFLSKALPEPVAPLELSSADYCWAFHSSNSETLLQLISEHSDGFWESYRSRGVGYWMQDVFKISKLIEKVAMNEFKKRRNPLDCMFFYLVLGKGKVLVGLLKASKGKRESEFLYSFLCNDFDNDEHRETARKYAFGFIQKKKYKAAAAFMILARNYEYAIRLCSRNLEDIQLAIVVSRILDLRLEPTEKSLFTLAIETELLSFAKSSKDSWLEHLGLWILGHKQDAIDILIPNGHSPKVFRPDVLFFLNAISSQATALQKGLTSTIEPKVLSTIAFESALQYFDMGWSILGLCCLIQLDVTEDDNFSINALKQLQYDTVGNYMAQRASLKPADNSDAVSVYEECRIISARLDLDLSLVLDNLCTFLYSHQLMHHWIDLMTSMHDIERISLFIRSEIESLLVLMRNKNYSRVSKETAERLGYAVFVLLQWKSRIKTEDMEHLVNSRVIEGIAAMGMFIVFLGRHEWDHLHTLLLSSYELAVLLDLARPFSHPQTVLFWINRFKVENGQAMPSKKEFIEPEMEVPAQMLFELLIVQLFVVSFRRYFITGANSFTFDDPNFKCFRKLLEAILDWWDESYFFFPQQIKIAIDYCERSVKSNIRLSDVLRPFTEIMDPSKSSLSAIIGYIRVGSLLASEITQIVKSPLRKPYAEPVEVFKLLHDLPFAIAFNSSDPLKLAVASNGCLHELNVDSALRYRTRDPSTMALVDKEFDTWEGSLHRFNQEEAEDRTPLDAFLYPSPLERALFLSRDHSLKTSQLPRLSQISCMTSKVYKDFATESRSSVLGARRQLFTTLAAHPKLPFYLSSNLKHQLHLWEFEWPSPLKTFPTFHLSRVSRLAFGESGNKFLASGMNGSVSLWNFDARATAPSQSFKAHSKFVNDCIFLKNDSLIATGGNVTDSGSVGVFDLLASPRDSLVARINTTLEKHSCSAIAYIPNTKKIIAGNSRGKLATFDLRAMKTVQETHGHDGSIHRIAYDPYRDFAISAGVDGDVKIWNAKKIDKPIAVYTNVCPRKTFFSHSGASAIIETFGCTDLSVSEHGIAVSGSDGTVKYFKALSR